jgi:cbb3-type cytochrome oxidase maturation protein
MVAKMTEALPMIAAALVLGIAALGLLLWSLAGAQYEDLEGASQRILMDDPLDAPPPAPSGPTERAASS